MYIQQQLYLENNGERNQIAKGQIGQSFITKIPVRQNRVKYLFIFEHQCGFCFKVSFSQVSIEIANSLWLCFHQDNFNQIKPEKSGNTVKTPRLGFSQLKMQAVFTSKNKGFSRLYERKFTQSYTTSRDGITCPDKRCSQSGRAQ